MIPRFARSALSSFAMLMLLSAPSVIAAEDTGVLSEEQQTAPLTAEQQVQLAATGHELAEKRCHSCHAIGTSDTSQNKDAPPFRELTGKWPVESLEESLAEGIVTGHEEMPEFVFTPEEITAFTEFLRTLEKAKQ